jgi:hypothetical protein
MLAMKVTVISRRPSAVRRATGMVRVLIGRSDDTHICATFPAIQNFLPQSLLLFMGHSSINCHLDASAFVIVDLQLPTRYHGTLADRYDPASWLS